MGLPAGLRREDAALLAAFLFGTVFVLAAYMPVLAPLMDGHFQYSYGDLNSKYGLDSARIYSEWVFHTFDYGTNRVETNRFFPIAAMSALSGWFPFSESQLLSGLIVLCIVLGSAGICLLARHFVPGGAHGAAAALMFVIFYFMNLWSVERLCHIWIWYTYAVFPLLLALGFMFLKDGRDSRLIAYSLVFSFFGFAPHSLIYALFFHAYLVAFAVFSGKKRLDALRLAALPLAAYALINLPPLTLGSSLSSDVVSGVGESGIYLLSRNGELQNLFAFSNNWWFQVGKAAIFSNPAFSWSSMLIFALAFLSFGICHKRFGNDERTAALLALLGMLAVIFVAQGSKNGVLAPALLEIAKTDLTILLRPFREWARVSLLIPALLITILAPCMNDKALRLPLLGVFLLLLIANLSTSPSWLYLSSIHAATYGVSDFSPIRETVGVDTKTLWPDTDNEGLATWTADGRNTTTRTEIRRISGSGQRYQSPGIWMYEKSAAFKAAPRPWMDALNIHDVISTEYRSAVAGYPWMVCEKLTQLTICHDDSPSQPFRIYDGAIIASEEAMEPFFHVAIEDYALTDSDAAIAQYAAVLNGNDSMESGAGRIFVFEAESGLRGRKYKRLTPFASNRTDVFMPGALTARFDAPEDGYYGIAALGNGTYTASIGNATFRLNASEGNFTVGKPALLRKGQANISIRSENGAGPLDAIFVFMATDDGSQGPFASGTPAPARIMGYERIGPTKWRMEISADRPFLLSFAETYDSRWLAEVYVGSELAATIRPVELYGTSNGYYVNETGELGITLRYEPQDMFERTMPISIASIALAFGLLGYSLWKEGDGSV